MSINGLPPNDLTISFYLLKKCKLWVWDFDDTLIDSTTYLKSDMNPASIRKRTTAQLNIEDPQWRYFKRLVEFLVMHGRYVAIASFGTYEIIKAYMDRIFGFNQNFFNKQNLVAPCMENRNNRRFALPPNKNEYIYQIMNVKRIQDFERVVLFDDLPSNIADAIGIGIIAIQIATPRNGDSDASKMFFGPWVMADFDSKIENNCKKGIYLNRTYMGVSNKNVVKPIFNPNLINNCKSEVFSNGSSSGSARDGSGGSGGSGGSSGGSGSESENDSNNTNNIRDSNLEPFSLISDFAGINGNSECNDYGGFATDTDRFNGMATTYGTGIGDRKILKKSEYRWNNMNVRKPPVWQNGIWKQPNDVTSTIESYPEGTLGGYSLTFWDDHQSVKPIMNPNKSGGGSGGGSGATTPTATSCDSPFVYYDNIYNNIDSNTNTPKSIEYNDNLELPSNHRFGMNSLYEGFEGGNGQTQNCNTCGKIGWSWITISLIIIIAMMAAVIFSVR